MFSNQAGTPKPPNVVLDCLEAGVRISQPSHIIKENISIESGNLHVNGDEYNLEDYSEIILLGGGNAAGRMAAALEDLLSELITDGIIISDDPVDLTQIRAYEGDHPLPNQAAQKGTQQLLKLAENANENTLVLAIITGGGSALLPAPAAEITLNDLRLVTEELLRCGATIGEINTVRKHISKIKGGRLADILAPATTIGLLISDVVGNDTSTVASGPIVPDTSTFGDAQRIIENYEIEAPKSVRNHLHQGAKGKTAETPHQQASFFDQVDIHVLADGRTAIDAAADVAREHGYKPLILSSRIRGEAREAAKTQVAIAEEIRSTETPCEEPVVLLSGGETTVTITGDGVGGPNQEFALSAALELSDDHIICASIDTDGIDGATDACGALIDNTTVTSIPDARAALRDNDAFSFLREANSLLFTGPTGTNVNDLRVIAVGDPENGE